MNTALKLELNPSVRFADEFDIKYILPLWKEWGKERGTETTDEKLTEETKRMIDTGRLFLLCVDNAIIGFMGGYIQDVFWSGEKIAREQCLYVTPAYRHGYGEMLVWSFEKWARFMGCTKVVISPSKSCTTRYEAAGRRLEGLGYSIHGFMMGKDLT